MTIIISQRFNLNKRMNIREHNSIEIAEHTKKAFQLFCKRSLAKQILLLLDNNKTKRQAVVSQSQIALEMQQTPLQGFSDKKNYYEQNDSLSKNTTHINKMNTALNREQSTTKITQLCYGDFVIIDIEIFKQQCRIYSHLDTLKLFNTKEISPNIFNTRKSAFQILCPTLSFKEEGERLTERSMICLKNVFTGCYVHLTSEISKSREFGYEIQLKPQLDKFGLFRLSQGEGGDAVITTDEEVSITCYYRSDLKIFISEEELMGKIDRSLIASYSQLFFRLTKLQDSNNLTSNPLYYISCVDIDKNIEIEQPNLEKFTVKKQIRELEIEESASSEKPPSLSQCDEFYELTAIRQSCALRVCESKPLNLCQIWQVQRTEVREDSLQCRIRSVISNQQLGSDCKDSGQSLSNFKRSSVLQLRRQDHNHFTILNDQNASLAVIYNSQTQHYVLKYDQDNPSQNQSLLSRTYCAKFQLAELQPAHTRTIYQLMQLHEVLKKNYSFVQRWGFRHEDRIDKVRYSLPELKRYARLMRRKVREVDGALDSLQAVMRKEENNLMNIQNIAKQLKLLELLILYCQVIKLKIGKPNQSEQRDIYRFASSHLKPTLFKLLQLVLLLTYHNKSCSQVIIEHNIIFNQLLKDYSEPIGCIIEEAIKNLCILTNKITGEEDVIFSWTAHIQQITDPQLFNIQQQYIDIISEVIVDPNDIGIHPYQYKIKEQLIGNRKKKILPKFALAAEKSDGLSQPLIIFQYGSFPIAQIEREGGSRALVTAFQLKNLFRDRKNLEACREEIGYISSMLKLMRNLCKDRNKKLAKIMEDYGLSVQFMHAVFKHREISWQIITKFLDLYCVMYIVQDPFLCFDKRQVKCYSWQKISSFDFSLKTGILFNQFTQENAAVEKQRTFDLNILPIFDHYFQDFEKLSQAEIDHSKIESFYNIISILYEVVNYGYLSHQCIQRYVKKVLALSDIVLRRESKSQRREKIVAKVVQLLTIAEEIWTIIQGMNLLLLNYQNLKQSKLTSSHYLRDIFSKALNYDPMILQQKINNPNPNPKKRKTSFNLKSSRQATVLASEQAVIDHSELDCEIIEFTLKKIVQNRFAINSKSLQSLLNLLEITTRRGQRICDFLDQIFILNSAQAEQLYLQYSGIVPMQSNASTKLLNVMKVKELVDKITQENLQLQDQTRKKEKILQLKYLLMKIIKKLQVLKTSNYRLFSVCQTLLKKLNLHCILIEVVKHHDKEHYQALIGQIILFFLQFTSNNQHNLLVLSQYFPLFTRRYSYQRLPQLLPALFSQLPNQQQSFWLVYRNIDKKMDQPHREILFQCIHNIIKICPPAILQHVKGQIIYNLITNNKFDDYIKGVIQSPSFVSIVCFVGRSSSKIAQRIKECISKTALFDALVDKNKGFVLKSIYLKLYHFLYIAEEEQIDQIEVQELVQKVFLSELKHLPASCHSRASLKLQQLKAASSKEVRETSAHEIENIVAEYSNLMLQGSEAVAISQEQHYFLYLLNIQNQGELSLLTCLKEILSKFQIACIDPLSNYIFKLINFMERIFLKEEKVYQSRILNKLYEISSLIQEKYNRSHQRQGTTHFKTAYSKVEAFFKKFARIIQEENISYSKILKCSGVHHSDIQSFRNYEHRQRLVLQSQFLQFMQQLVDNMNNRQQFLELASEVTMKEFFILYSQKDSHKVNIIKFVSKLIETLEFQKNTALCRHYNQSRKAEDFQQPKNQEKPQPEAINCQLLKRQLYFMKHVFQLHLGNFMTERINTKLTSLFHQAESQTFPDFLSLSSHNILEIHIKNSQYSIMNLIIHQILQNVNFCRLLEGLDEKSWEKYFSFLASVLQKNANIYIIRTISSLYSAIENNHTVFGRFLVLVKGFISKCYAMIEEERIIQEINTCTVHSQLYALLAKVMRNRLICEDQGQAIETCISNHFIVVFQRYSTHPNSYWGNQCSLILKTILSSFKSYKTISLQLSSSPNFISNFQQMLVSSLSSGITNTNTNSQLSIKIMNSIIHLLIKFRSKHLTASLAKIMLRWPYKTILTVFEKHYTYIIAMKQQSNDPCEDIACSKEFCNYNTLTDYDHYLMEVLTNLLLVIHIASEIITTKESLKQLNDENKEILLNYSTLRSQKQPKSACAFGKYWHIIKSLNLKLQQNQTFYFSLPYNPQLDNQQLQQQVQTQLSSINKQNYFHNLYHISFYIENQYQQMRALDQGYFSRYIFRSSNVLQYFFIIYLTVLSFNQIYTGFNIPLALVFFLNAFIIVVKSVLFVIQGRKLYYQHLLLSEVKYDKSLRVWKYSKFIISLLAIVSYCMQTIYQQFYAVTFALQLMNVQQVEKAIVMLGKMLRSTFYLVLFVQALLVSCAFLLYQKQKSMGISSPLIDTYLNLVKQTILLQFVPIEMSDPQSFPYLKSKPQLVPIINSMLIYIQAVILAMFILQLLSDFKISKQRHKKCDICGYSKQYLQSTGKNYNSHIAYQHNIWNYIEFFIYIRSKGSNKEVEEMRLSELIEKQDFRFLKV